MMRRAFATLFFVLGCLLSGFAIVWWIAAEFWVLIGPRTGLEGVIAFIPYAILMGVTLDRYSARNWPPVLRVTHSGTFFARVLLSLTGAICLIAIVVTLAGRAMDRMSLLEHAFSWLIGSLLLLNGVYVALHWAYRPHNLFGPHVPEALMDRLGSLVLAILKVTRRMVKRPGRNGSKCDGGGLSKQPLLPTRI